jgi:hypothetical protein
MVVAILSLPQLLLLSQQTYHLFQFHLLHLLEKQKRQIGLGLELIHPSRHQSHLQQHVRLRLQRWRAWGQPPAGARWRRC